MLQQKFNAMALKNKKDDPVEWLTEMEYLRDQLVSAGATVMEYDVMEQVLNNLPREYQHVVLKLEDRLGNNANPLTLADLQNELNLRYQQLGFGAGNTRRTTKEGKETALFAGRFKGKCNLCRKYGHKSFQCRCNGKGNNNSYKTRSGGSFRGKCFNCQETGHHTQDCPKKRQTNNQANVTKEMKEEVSFIALGLQSLNIENQPTKDARELFIADSGASIHMVASDKGMFNC